MTLKIVVVLAGGWLTTAACAQQSFHFTTPQTQQDLLDTATALRTVVGLQEVSVDETTSTVAFNGAAAQVEMAGWILGELDRPGGETAVHEFKTPTGDLTRVNFLANVSGPMQLTELMTALRAVADIRNVSLYRGRNAVVMTGPARDIAFAEWIIEQLNQPAAQTHGVTPRAYTITGVETRAGGAARVNYLSDALTPQGQIEILTVLRTVDELQRVFFYSERHALVLRGEESQVARAQWLIQALDPPPDQPKQESAVYRVPGADDLTQVSYLPDATPQSLNAAITAIRTEVKIQRVFYTNVPAALVVRGTAEQVAAAARLVK